MVKNISLLGIGLVAGAAVGTMLSKNTTAKHFFRKMPKGKGMFSYLGGMLDNIVG